jgi:hypothetical protein
VSTRKAGRKAKPFCSLSKVRQRACVANIVRGLSDYDEGRAVVQRLKKTFPDIGRPITKLSVMWLVSKLKISMNSLADLGFFIKNLVKTNADLKSWPSSESVSAWAKTECLPEGVTVSERAARVPLQNLFNKWAER